MVVEIVTGNLLVIGAEGFVIHVEKIPATSVTVVIL